MTLSLTSFLAAKRGALNNQGSSLSPATNGTLRWLFSYLAQFNGSLAPELQVKPFARLSDSETIIADVACKLYCVTLVKATTTATFSKLTDSATTSSDAASELRFWSARIGDECHIWPSGLAFANGITMQGNTTANGGTSSGADGCTGFCIVGAA